MSGHGLGETPYARITALMARLRRDCPWDSTQSFETIAPYTIEESYEVADAIARDDMAELKIELGDLLFQVLFHAQLASERADGFDFTDVCDGLVEKMVRRHPHVFAGADKPDWDTIKAVERTDKGETSLLDGVALALPELMRAEKLQKRAARIGFDWPDVEQVYDKIDEEIAEVREAKTQDEKEDEIGDVLFAAVNLARHMNVAPEVALRRTNAKFSARFQYIEKNAEKPLTEMDLDSLEALWVDAKKAGV